MDGSPPGSPVPGILQARTLEWVAISFSNAWKWKVKLKTLSRVQLLAIPWTTAQQAPPSMGEYWSGGPLPSPDKLLTASAKKKKKRMWMKGMQLDLGKRSQSKKKKKEEERKSLTSHWVPRPSHTSLTSQEGPEAINFYFHSMWSFCHQRSV